MASLIDVAKLAGVSKSTVSRVINNEGAVKPATRKAVEEAISNSGYVVNQVAKDLKSNKTNLIGVIVPRVSSHATSQGIDGLTKVLEVAGKQVLLANCRQTHEKELEFIRLFNEKRVEGIVMFATHIDEAFVTAIKKSRAPVILVGQDSSRFDIPCIVHDDFRVGYSAATHLISQGCKSLAMIGVDFVDVAVGSDRYQGVVSALEQYNQSLLFHSQGDFSIDSGFQQMKQALAEGHRPDAVFCATDRIAIGAIKAATSEGLNVGSDIKIIGVGNDEMSSVVTPSLSTFDIAFEAAGENAAKMLLDILTDKQSSVSKTVLGFNWIQRQSG